MFDVTNNNESKNKKSSSLDIFLSKVIKVFKTEEDFLDLDKDNDYVSVYNDNTNISDKDTKYYGAIDFKTDDTFSVDKLYHAFPFDKNNFTFPLVGETVLIMNVNGQYFWLPYSLTHYPNFREDYKTSELLNTSNLAETNTAAKSKDYKTQSQTGISTSTAGNKKEKKSEYNVKETIKFLKPKEGDTIISGRVGNTIRFSEFHLTEDGKTTSPSIFIRNRQNPELDSQSIGTLIDEDINKDGTSIYITSNKVKVPFTETIKKTKIGFKDYPNSKDLSGDQLFINSDRIILSSKAKEFIIFGKANTGIITDGNFSVDAEKEIYLHSNNKVTIHSAGANQIFLNSENGKIYLGKNTGEGAAGAAVQKMVLGGELVKIMGELIDEITKQIYATPVGPTAPGPTNAAAFKAIKGKLNTLLSAKNFLSKS
jgi:hypothetical protein